MSAKNGGVIRWVGRGEGNFQFGLRAEFFQRLCDALRTFGMAGGRIAGATFIGDDDHARSLAVLVATDKLDAVILGFAFEPSGQIVFGNQKGVMKKSIVLLAVLFVAKTVFAWNYEGHHA